jgi:uncharacterized protein YbcI
MGFDETATAGAGEENQAQRISREMVRFMCEIAGRGPTRARTTIARDHVLVMFSETLTAGERVLVDNGHVGRVAELRAGYQDVLRDRAVAMITEVLGRRVRGFMSANHFDPDLAAEIFVLERAEEPPSPKPVEAEHSDH